KRKEWEKAACHQSPLKGKRKSKDLQQALLSERGAKDGFIPQADDTSTKFNKKSVVVVSMNFGPA
ncbi:unnamed protein product, partial [Heterosigma akashiwo]